VRGGGRRTTVRAELGRVAPPAPAAAGAGIGAAAAAASASAIHVHGAAGVFGGEVVGYGEVVHESGHVLSAIVVVAVGGGVVVVAGAGAVPVSRPGVRGRRGRGRRLQGRRGGGVGGVEWLEELRGVVAGGEVRGQVGGDGGARREVRVGEVGAGAGAAEGARGAVVGHGGLLRRVEGPQPVPLLGGRVPDLRRVPAPRPATHAQVPRRVGVRLRLLLLLPPLLGRRRRRLLLRG